MAAIRVLLALFFRAYSISLSLFAGNPMPAKLCAMSWVVD